MQLKCSNYCSTLQAIIGLPLNEGQDFGFTPNKRPD
jgi:hypothetical protein